MALRAPGLFHAGTSPPPFRLDHGSAAPRLQLVAPGERTARRAGDSSATIRVWVDDNDRVPLAEVDRDIIDRALQLQPYMKRTVIASMDRSMVFRARTYGLTAVPVGDEYPPPRSDGAKSSQEKRLPQLQIAGLDLALHQGTPGAGGSASPCLSPELRLPRAASS